MSLTIALACVGIAAIIFGVILLIVFSMERLERTKDQLDFIEKAVDELLARTPKRRTK